MRMRWHDLLFAHWAFDPEVVRDSVPNALKLDTFNGQAWIAVVPFRMSDVAPRGVPAIPWLSAFPEMNVRTYVTFDGKPGVWFFSLDATNPIAVRVARWAFHLAYMDANISIIEKDGWYRYSSQRTHRGETPATFVGKYRPTGDVFFASPGTLEYWLTARYCMYTTNRRGKLLRGEIDHPPWPLQQAELVMEENTMFEQISLSPMGDPHLLFSSVLDVQAWTNDLVQKPI